MSYSYTRIPISRSNLVFPNIEVSYNIPFSIGDIVSYDSYYPSRSYVTCTFCNGEKKVTSTNDSTLSATCPRCNGTGKINYNLIHEEYGQIKDIRFYNTKVGESGHSAEYLIQPCIREKDENNNIIYKEDTKKTVKWIKCQRYADTETSINLNYNEYRYDMPKIDDENSNKYETVKDRYVGAGKYFTSGYAFNIRLVQAASPSTSAETPTIPDFTNLSDINDLGVVFTSGSRTNDPNWEFYQIIHPFLPKIMGNNNSTAVTSVVYRYCPPILTNNTSASLSYDCPFCDKENSRPSGFILGKDNTREKCPICHGTPQLHYKKLPPWAQGIMPDSIDPITGGQERMNYLYSSHKTDSIGDVKIQLRILKNSVDFDLNQEWLTTLGIATSSDWLSHSHSDYKNNYYTDKWLPIKQFSANDPVVDDKDINMQYKPNIVPINYTVDPLAYFLINNNMGFSIHNLYVNNNKLYIILNVIKPSINGNTDSPTWVSSNLQQDAGQPYLMLVLNKTDNKLKKADNTFSVKYNKLDLYRTNIKDDNTQTGALTLEWSRVIEPFKHLNSLRLVKYYPNMTGVNAVDKTKFYYRIFSDYVDANASSYIYPTSYVNHIADKEYNNLEIDETTKKYVVRGCGLTFSETDGKLEFSNFANSFNQFELVSWDFRNLLPPNQTKYTTILNNFYNDI